ncbi:MAG: GNAT family N-acetyltransferase [Steroidobacteraceae bacterium]|nr:N-acetyltransferase [Nevskiaceae bacterium]MCP5359701.1 N-acetyltransferase [Nevskiaceae bacterium]
MAPEHPPPDLIQVNARPDIPSLRVEVVRSVAQVPAAGWNALAGSTNPFVRHEFLAALEQTGCIGPGTGWEACLVTLHDDAGLAAGAPAWIKSHSYGEFVFDFSWAQAYARVGQPYYPKLVVAAPFTPATGPRLLVRPDLDRALIAPLLQRTLADLATDNQLSSVHVLFPDEHDRDLLQRDGWLMRRDCQFHWTNHGYADFDAFLAGFTADKRKKAKRERRRVAELGISFETQLGSEIAPQDLARVWDLHRDTFLRHGHEPYLTREFFDQACRTCGDALLFKLARRNGRIVATAIFFIGGDTLYGRYWGASADFHSLHFETCYHQGIEFCIERGLRRFEPGTQGEHKVSRGFEPTLTWSSHYITDPRFRAAIGDYLRREAASVDDYAAAVRAHIPYRDRRDAAGTAP